MNRTYRMAAALVLAVIALTLFAMMLPDYVASVQSSIGTREPAVYEPPAWALIGGLAGLCAFGFAIVEQWRRREYGWIVASFVLSYPAIIAYAITNLVQMRRTAREPA